MPEAYFRCHADIVGRGKGRGVKSALVAAAYRSGQKLHFEREDQTIDYTRRRGVVVTDILTPSDAPDWMQDRAKLWNAIEGLEKRHDARLARDFTLSLPHQFNEAQMREAVTGFLTKQFVAHGLVCDFAIHAPGAGDARNYHAHALVTERSASEAGFSAKKDRSLIERSKVEEWRTAWEAELNHIMTRDRVCDQHGELYFVDRRSYAERGLDREAGIHLGPAASKLERAGIETEAGNINRRVQARNAERAQLREAADELTDRIQSEERQIEKRNRLKSERAMPEWARSSSNRSQSRGWDLER